MVSSVQACSTCPQCLHSSCYLHTILYRVCSPFHLTFFSLLFYQVLSEQMATSLTGVLDRINSQWFRISQRLQWAAGSTSSLNATIDEFERAMNRRKLILQVLLVG